MLSSLLCSQIKSSDSKLLAVTKYWGDDKTHKILHYCQSVLSDKFYGIWENRLKDIQSKTLDRAQVHFIGNIQSRNISAIVENCSVIHSLWKLEHAKKINSRGKKIDIFIQICLDPEKNIGIQPHDLDEFIRYCSEMTYLNIIWISLMGSGEFTTEEKINEFEMMKKLREQHLPHGLISAGTSRDYAIALECGIDIVRVGTALLENI